MTDWFRSWHGAPTDPKWLGIARKASVAPGIAVAVAWALMDRASQASERGSIEGYDADGLACFYGCEPEQVEAIVAAMSDKGMIADGRLTSWEKRQPKREDNAAERAKEWRERKRTQANAAERPDTDTDTDSSDANASSSPEPAKAAPVASSPTAIELPCVSGEDYPVSEADLVEWGQSFPAVDSRQQLSAIRSWLIANPTRRKTRKGMRRFVVSWLDRAQNRAPAPQRQATAPPRASSQRTPSDVFAEIAAGTWAGPPGQTDEPAQPYIDASFSRRN